MPVVREDGRRFVRLADDAPESDDRWEHPFPRTGRVLHAHGQDSLAGISRQAATAFALTPKLGVKTA